MTIFDWKNDRAFAQANGFEEDTYHHIVAVSPNNLFNHCTFRNFPRFYAENMHFYNCIFEDCNEIAIDEGEIHNSVFQSVDSLFLSNGCVENVQFLCLKADGEEDAVIFLEDADISNCTFEDVELRNKAWLCDAVGDCSVEHCTFTNCRTERSDRELFHCEMTVGKILKKEIEVSIVDEDTRKAMLLVTDLDGSIELGSFALEYPESKGE